MEMDLFHYDQRDPNHRAASLEELCQFADQSFVRCAFVTILGRKADPTGEAHYLNRVRQGESKLSILWDLRRSREGRAHDPGIAGLDRALRSHRTANLPVIGQVIRLFTRSEGNSAVERRLRAIVNTLSVECSLAAARAARANHMHHVMLSQMDVIERQLKNALAGRNMSSQQIASAEAAGDTDWESTLTSVLGGS